jgi:hypothetical protein
VIQTKIPFTPIAESELRTMRKRLVPLCTLAALLMLPFTQADVAFAQGAAKKVPKTAAGATPKPPKKGATIDADEEDPVKKGKGAETAADKPRLTPGNPTTEAANGKRLLKAQQWLPAATALYRVYKGETGDDPGNQEIAAFELATALYNLNFFHASYSLLAEIAKRPNHLRFNEALLWLAKLATQLPEPADVVQHVGKYSEDQIGRFNNKNLETYYWQLNYLLGSYKYRSREFGPAVGLFSKVPKKSKYYVKSQFLTGASFVQLRKSVPAVKSFQRVVQAIDDGSTQVDDDARLRDLAYLSMARTFYSASIKLDENNTPTVNPKRLSAAVKFWNTINTGSEYWLDGLFEESWAYFMAGDYPRALGNIHTIQAPFFPNAFYPEAYILRAQILFATCQYKDATTVVARFKIKYEPIVTKLKAELKKFGTKGQEAKAYTFFKNLKDGKASIDPEIKPIVDNALSDRRMLKNLDYVRVIENEIGLYKKVSGSIKNPGLRSFINSELTQARMKALTKAGSLVQRRYNRMLDELNEHIRDSKKIIIDISAAERGKIEQTAKTGTFSEQDAKIYGVVEPDEEHVLWPFDGEYWRDELGFYRQVVVSKCGRLER